MDDEFATLATLATQFPVSTLRARVVNKQGKASQVSQVSQIQSMGCEITDRFSIRHSLQMSSSDKHLRTPSNGILTPTGARR
jgi:hypothetical protein